MKKHESASLIVFEGDEQKVQSKYKGWAERNEGTEVIAMFSSTQLVKRGFKTILAVFYRPSYQAKSFQVVRKNNGSDVSIKRNTVIMEKFLIREALKLTLGNRTKAAEILEISHRTLLYKIREYGLE